ncbi:hypothetical protein MBH78_00855 [Oceanimonas sp. NS1]|nr:hypothetical protein [Oceanimonas sp. NS1]
MSGGDSIADELNRQAAFAGHRLGSKDAHSPAAHWVASDAHPAFSKIAGDNMDLRWPLHAVPGTRGFELLDGLPHPADYDFLCGRGGARHAPLRRLLSRSGRTPEYRAD